MSRQKGGHIQSRGSGRPIAGYATLRRGPSCSGMPPHMFDAPPVCGPSFVLVDNDPLPPTHPPHTHRLRRLPGQQALLLLGEASARDYGLKTLDFYASKSMMLRTETLQELAALAALPEDTLRKELSAYNGAVDGASVDAWGKKVFPNRVQLEGPFYVSWGLNGGAKGGAMGRGQGRRGEARCGGRHSSALAAMQLLEDVLLR